ncbi:MAG TPA: ATP-binding protein [Candidatus Nanoarchaeia archaeon]|nr:ATP-binding protein [Candidatus Nanoarchaeia archaeon]
MKESETLELKKSTSELKEAIISIVAILNKHQKGEVYFGVNPSGRVIGQTVTENTIREVSQTIAQNIEPKIFPMINEVTLEGKKCVHVEFSGDNVPYFAYGRAHIRVGDENRQLSAEEIKKMILETNKHRMAWDKEVCKEAKISDISTQKLKWFLKKAGKHFDTVENSLKKLGLLSQGKLLNTAVILFGRNPEKFFPNAKLRCAVFGETKAVTIDMQEYVGDLFTLIEKAEKYILENIHVGMRLEGMYRVDVPEIDKEAFREAIINAFCHRDYYLYDSVNIAIFKNKLEIRSPGLLCGGLTVEKIKTKEVSERRNELLAEMFHQVHFIEKWGRGIGLILSKEPDTNFEEVGRQFVVTFKRKSPIPETREKTREKIIQLIRENPRITTKELAEKTGLTAKGVEWNIKGLKDEKKLRRVGGRKEGYWEILETTKK